MEEHLQLIDRLLTALPSTVDVGGTPPVGHFHAIRPLPGETATSLQELACQPPPDPRSDGKQHMLSCDPVVGRAQSIKELAKLQVWRDPTTRRHEIATAASRLLQTPP